MMAIRIPIAPILSAPPNAVLWRYMGLSKFLSMLRSNALYFPRADLLGDPWEGAYPKHVIAAMREEIRTLHSDQDIEKVMKHFIHDEPKEMFISCWHMNEHESAAMWKLYSQSDDSIAICTTVEVLERQLFAAMNEIMMVGQVTYGDYSQGDEYWNRPNFELFQPFFGKRRSFAHEREVRALCYYGSSTEKIGLDIPVKLESLIDRIYVSPTSPSWLTDVVRDVMSKYGLDKINVSQSTLYNTPVY